jgi:hypothetical protein
VELDAGTMFRADSIWAAFTEDGRLESAEQSARVLRGPAAEVEHRLDLLEGEANGSTVSRGISVPR